MSSIPTGLEGIERVIAERHDFERALWDIRESVRDAADAISRAFENGHKLLIFGNGGSAADAQHMAAEFVGRFHPPETLLTGERWVRRGLPAIALTTDSSILTAVANDWEYSYVFQRQLEALLQPGDVVLGISTSGRSESVLRALDHACDVHGGHDAIGLTSGDGGDMASNCNRLINVGSGRTPIVQERMLAVEHIICELVEERLRPLGVL